MARQPGYGGEQPPSAHPLERWSRDDLVSSILDMEILARRACR
ncbi:hypothetical protein AB0F30_33275 [Streptomyces sp. NPDC029006]